MRRGNKFDYDILGIFIISVTLFLTGFNFVFAQNSGSSGNATLIIYDNALPADPIGSIKLSNSDVIFYGNFTNSSGSVINSTQGNGDCEVRFNFTGTWSAFDNMTYNATSFLWEYNRTFNYKGNHTFQSNCTSNFGNVTLNDYFTVENTAPIITRTLGGTYIDFDGDTGTHDYWQCNEDTLCAYNFSSNITEPDVNDVLTYTNSSANTTLTNYAFNVSTSVLEVNVTNNSISGVKTIKLEVTDTDSGSDAGILRVNITSVNDAPVFVNLINQSFNMTELFEYIVNITDEENNTDFTLSINFTSCSVAQWSTRNCTTASGRELFNSSQYTFNGTTGILNISFTPIRNDVGSYIIDFNVTDSGSPNSSRIKTVNFTVININAFPYFVYVCDNERNATEDTEFTCYINSTDIDETNNLTFSTNYFWFSFNDTGTNTTFVVVNSSTSFNASAFVNFTPTDSNIGNWSINVTMVDTEDPNRFNSTSFWFYVYNINDSVSLDAISNLTAYTSNNYTIKVNATDDDLLITQENVYNESLTFNSNNSNVAVSSSEVAGTNKTQATMSFDPNDLGLGNHSINISVNDSNGFSKASRVFTIEVLGNNPPTWNSTTETNHTPTEGNEFYLNLSLNVTDSEGDNITFSYSSDTSFPSFSIGSTTGIINFTANDSDIGQHLVTINASDSVATSSLTFNFTVSNINDNPSIETPITLVNATKDLNSNTNATEDNYTTLTIFVDDDDFFIPSGQKTFYNESITLNLTIQGSNVNLFSFVEDTASYPSAGKTKFDAIFTPNKTDVGNYNITINATDLTNASSSLTFNLTVFQIEHAPIITEINNLSSSIIETIYTDINSTDSEDINETFSGGNLTYSMINLTSGGNFLSINSSTGIINFTLNESNAGIWEFNISVNDSSGKTDSFLWKLTVYDYPKISTPLSSFQFSMVENTTSQMNFSVNHTIGISLNDTLNYSLYINGVLRNSTSGNGNGTDFLWNFTSNFTDETTCLSQGIANLTLNVSNTKLSNSTTWNLTINHSNYPIVFSTNISDTTSTSLTLSDYFTDIDASSSCNNQTIGFAYSLLNSSGGTITVSITNWTNTTTPTIDFSASTTGTANYTVTAYEYNGSSYNSSILKNVTSNNFSVSLTVTQTQTPSSGGGGGGSSNIKPISLKIIVPEPITSKRKDKLILPITAVNTGQVTLKDIILFSTVAKNGILREDLLSSFDKSLISELKAGESENLTLIVDVNTQEFGLYEITINATVRDPEYNDWAKLFINVEESENIEERILFTEEFIIGNPECAELKEVVDEAKDDFYKGDTSNASLKLDRALESCKQTIEQEPKIKPRRTLEQYLFNYIGLISIVIFLIGFSYHAYKRRRLRKEAVSFQGKLKDMAYGYGT